MIAFSSHPTFTSSNLPFLLVALLGLLLTCFTSVSHAGPSLTLSNLFSSNMVLQRSPHQALMWGWASTGATVTVTLDDGSNVNSTAAGSDGRWTAQLPAQSVSFDRTITVSDGSTTLTLSNVAFGDVYLCGGQSNMQVTLNYSFGGNERIANSSRYPNIRLFNLQLAYSNVTLDQAAISYPTGWVLPSASTLQNANNLQDTWSYFSASCYWAGSTVYDATAGEVPIGLLAAVYGGTTVHAWTSPDTNTRCGPTIDPQGGDNTAYNHPSVLYNAMIHPLLPLRLRAVLWYQGETDWYDADRYACSFPNLIEDWRAKFNQSWLPFYFVELAATTSVVSGVRLTQQRALSLPMTGVANAIDLGDRTAPAGDVHARNKSYVGDRLARLLLRNLYSQDVQAEGPVLLSVRASASNSSGFRLTLQYSDDSRSDGLFALPTPGCDAKATDASGCCTASDDGTYSGLLYYSWADSTGAPRTASGSVRVNSTGHFLTLTAPTAPSPAAGQRVQVSYADVNYPGCALYNAARLPALPFALNVTVEAADPPLAFANLYSSNMVLQRGQRNMLWGTGAPGRTVRVTATGLQDGQGVVADNGEWRAYLDATAVATGVTITASDGDSTLSLDNVAFGDVYLCSGQSNMKIDLNYSFGGAEEIAHAARYPNIRLFSVPQQWSDTPLSQSNLDPALGQPHALRYLPSGWQVPSAATLQNPADPSDVWTFFSAVAWWTGRHLSDALNGSVPIGLIHSSVGGTCIAAWNSHETNTRCGQIVEPPKGGFDDAPRNQPSALYNAMIHPLHYARTGLAAVLWYQSEEDYWWAPGELSAIERYHCAFPNLIQDWRTLLGGASTLPFYFVQLAPYTDANNSIPPLLREAQLSGLGLPLTGVANAIDLGDMHAPAAVGNIHPRNKSVVGERLTRWLLRDVYGRQQLQVHGPQPSDFRAAFVDSSDAVEVRVRFSGEGRNAGLFALGTPDCDSATRYGCCAPVNDSTVGAGLLELTFWQDGVATSHSADTSITTSGGSTWLTTKVSGAVQPRAGVWVEVAYAWQPFPGCALYNEARLPALPFRMNVPIDAPPAPPAPPAAAFRLNNAFSNNMVLQRAPQQAVLWGYGEPGRTVTASLDDKQVAKSLADSYGNWTVQLPATDTSLNRTLTLSDGDSTVQLTNVAFGDVYLCSGQSNMMIVLNYSYGGPEAMARAWQYPNIRLFNIFMQYDSAPRNETGVSYSPDSWVLPSNGTLQNLAQWNDVFSYFSGVCYWTAMHLYDSMQGAVPLGLMHSSWGGTAIQAWTSPDANHKCGPLLTPGLNTSQNQPSVLYNAQIHPLTPMRLSAILWLQGESDDFDVERYGCSFPAMIVDWRDKFGYGPELPFYFALLAPFVTEADAFVGLRQSQLQALRIENVGVVNTLDLGDIDAWQGSVHPRNKSYVGERYARWLRRDIYGERVQVYGPLHESVSASLDGGAQQLTVIVTLEPRTSYGLFALATPDCANSTGGYGCCAASDDKVTAGLLEVVYAAQGGGNITSSGTVMLAAKEHTLTLTLSGNNLPAASQTVLVSHAWQGFPGCALYNEARLPALPFQVTVTVASAETTFASVRSASVFRFNNFFSSNMVLQRSPQQAVLWGYGAPASTVTARVDGQSVASSIVTADGDWRVQLPTHDASFNHNVTVSDGSTSVTLVNVAFGDVYLCSGQSNMEIGLNYSFGGAELIANAARYPNIRLWNLHSSWNDSLLNESSHVSYSPDTWQLPSATSLNNNDPDGRVWDYFSGTCYWTGVHLSNALNNSMPIGLVHSSFGGTIVESWTSNETNTKCGPITLPDVVFPNNYPSGMYRAMIHPLLPMRFAAVLWYQGQPELLHHSCCCCPLCHPTHLLSFVLPCWLAYAQVSPTITRSSATSAHSPTSSPTGAPNSATPTCPSTTCCWRPTSASTTRCRCCALRNSPAGPHTTSA